MRGMRVGVSRGEGYAGRSVPRGNGKPDGGGTRSMRVSMEWTVPLTLAHKAVYKPWAMGEVGCGSDPVRDHKDDGITGRAFAP